MSSVDPRAIYFKNKFNPVSVFKLIILKVCRAYVGIFTDFPEILTVIEMEDFSFLAYNMA